MTRRRRCLPYPMKPAFAAPVIAAHSRSGAKVSSFVCSPYSPRNDAHRHSRRSARHAQRSISATTAPISTTEESGRAKLSVSSELHLYNTLSRKKERFTTVEPGVVRFYSCGPTVYDFAHVGNFRAFLTYDVVKRWLLCKGYDVRHVMNITDVDDKIIKKIQQLGCSAEELTTKYADAFFADLDALNVIPAQHYPRATKHINEIEKTINSLRERGYAYEREGSIYFSVNNFEAYGRLAQLEKRESGSLTTAVSEANESDEYDKEDLRDFALWKSYKSEDGEVSWENTLGKGRPGWHIECTCMAMKYLGPELDIHGGGVDLVFPHHENEIAQSEALTGKTFARFWVHNGFVNINNEKMSKSLGNFRTLRDITRQPDDARAFRYLVVSSQYRSALSFTDQAFKSAKSTIKRLDALRSKLAQAEGDGGGQSMAAVISQAQEDFQEAMDDDLNTPRAAAAMFSVVNAAEKILKAGDMGSAAAKSVSECLEEMDRVFGIFYKPCTSTGATEGNGAETATEISQELLNLLEKRAKARLEKNFAKADEIRDEIAAAGFSIIDTPQGPTLKPLAN
eukprot:GFKZ01007344.1.p1 GENE.GFKZ01007344.1~~GFKZ01007344.1.p1  ORF type:complete len:567 (+),score=67.60 GFKZ01007344.1:54-1754(+)